ncbi:hypothetical protein ACEPAF_6396 [Sanghuangporus sanghuang]
MAIIDPGSSLVPSSFSSSQTTMLPAGLVLFVLSSLCSVGKTSPVQLPLALSPGTRQSDMYYRPDSAESTACHRRKPKKEKERGGPYGLPYGDCDSPFTLTNFTLDFLEKHWAKEVDFVIWTGDSARHDNDREIPRTPDEIYELNRAMAHRMNEVFTSRGIPVVPTLGNNDVWRPNSITNEFSSIWRTFIPFESFQVFQRGGYYSVEVIPNEVAVISLNTMYFYDSNKAVGGCEYGDENDPGNLQFDWLEVQLDRYRERGLQVWVSGHVPPSPGNYFPGCFVRYADLALRYQDTILGHLFGHMNVDHFFFLESEDTILPDEDLGATRRKDEIDEQSHSSLAEVLFGDFSALPKKAKMDLDEYAIINVGPSVVPNPYLPTFRVYAYNATGKANTEDEGMDGMKKKKKEKKKEPKRKHGHRHPGRETKIDCKKKANRSTWACRPEKPHYASKNSPSRHNTRWTPLGYAQYWLPGLADISKNIKPKFKLEYTTMSKSEVRRLFPMKELPKSLRNDDGGDDGAEVAKKGRKYTPYELSDLTIGSYLSLARRLGDSKEGRVRALFRRHSSSSTAFSTDLASPADSPPSAHALASSAVAGHPGSLKSSTSGLRQTHIRAARAATSPYPRDAESVYSSSSENEDMSLFFSNPSPPDYTQMYIQSQHGSSVHAHPHQHEHISTIGQFGRMTLGPDHALEQLAANVRAATTTSASDRAKQIFVQAWLNANYAPYPDGNVPRQGLYLSYRRVCDQYGIPHINTATLGKAIRLCFPAIKTRRLGVRGNSKYHYCGIRPTTATEIEWLQDYVRKSNSAAAVSKQNVSGTGQGAKAGEDHSEDDDDEDGSEGAAPSTSGSKRNSLTINNGMKSPSLIHMDTDKTPTTNTLLSQAQASQRASFPPHATIRRHTLGADPLTGAAIVPGSHAPSPPTASAAAFIGPVSIRSVRELPGFPDIEEALGPDPSSPHGIAARDVWRWFEDHLNALLDSVRNYRFDQFEMNLRSFWSSLSGDHREVVHAPAVAGLMAKADALVYNEILEILRSQMLSPIPPQALTSLRQLADKMEKILLLALENYGNTFVEPKVELGARFGHLVLRFLDIFQVTQALSTVLTNPKQLADMRRSWQLIDFESVRNQSALVCNCRHEDLVQLLEVDFVALLNNISKSTEPVGEVMAWADNVCVRLMGAPRGPVTGVEERSTLSSRSILIRWGYVTSQIMRDLTIRSDPAFGAFQILKLFLDDWIGLNVLRSVALSTNSVAASVEPVIQQQLFTMSPMQGQEQYVTGVTGPAGASILNDTPTTSSMLAALHDSFGGNGLDATGAFDSGMSMSFVDPSGVSHDAGMFGDYGSGNAFDVPAFTPQDLGLNSDAASVHSNASEHSQHSSPETNLAVPVKDETGP